MPEQPRHNLELKARCADLDAVRARVRRLDVRSGGVQVQTDTYFHATHGRLKLREIEGESAVLIWYDRPDQAAARSSRYHLVPVEDANGMKAALTAALGVRGIVPKRREIYFHRNVRIHLDEVAGLGTFIELEAVLAPGDDLAAAQALLDELSAALGVAVEDLRAGSYGELVQEANAKPPSEGPRAGRFGQT